MTTFRNLARIAAVMAAVLWTSAADAFTLRTVALTGQPAPGTEPGITFRGMRSPVINAKGEVAFLASLFGAPDELRAKGIWSEGGGALHRSVMIGDEVSTSIGSYVVREISPFVLQLDDAGNVLMLTARDDDYEEPDSMWRESQGNVELLFHAHQSHPGLNGEAIEEMWPLSFDSNANSVVVFGRLDNGLGAYWNVRNGQVDLALRMPGPAPGVDANFLLYDTRMPSISANRRGTIIVNSYLERDWEFVGSGVWSNESGELLPFVLSGDLAPGHQSDEHFAFFRWSEINDSGQVFFGASIRHESEARNSFGFWMRESGELRQLFTFDSQPPGFDESVTWKSYSNEAPAFGSEGHVAFSARVQGPGIDQSNDQALWVLSEDGALRRVARAGDPAPGMPEGAIIEELSFGDGVKINKWGQIAFSASLKDENGKSMGWAIWAEGAQGLELVVHSKTPLEVAPGDFRLIEVEDWDSRWGFNDRGQLAFSAYFKDGTSGVFVAQVGSVPEPNAIVVFVVGMALVANRRRAEISRLGTRGW
jgi:hypothetical protein